MLCPPHIVKHDSNIFTECLGYGKGSGTFHIPDGIYNDILIFKNKEIDTAFRYRTGS